MTFHPLAQQAVQQLPHEGAVVELGNQRFTAEGGHASTEAFYKSLGFENYTALDVNTRMGAVVVDLNDRSAVRKANLAHSADLVTNNGTGEHIFNQAAVFENCHALCKPGGTMLHILPVSPWVNHGFYNYNPILFRDLAQANGYEWLFFWLSDRWGNRAELDESDFDELFREKRPEALERTISQVLAARGGDVSLVVAWKKSNASEFRTPFQGKYVGDIADDGLKEAYG